MISDVIESFVGKVFDGSGSSLGITTGVSKGQRDAIMTRDMDRKLDFVTYSEDNIIWLGTANKGTNMTNIDVRQMGSPIANSETVRVTEKAGGKISETYLDDPATGTVPTVFGTYKVYRDNKKGIYYVNNYVDLQGKKHAKLYFGFDKKHNTIVILDKNMNIVEVLQRGAAG